MPIRECRSSHACTSVGSLATDPSGIHPTGRWKNRVLSRDRAGSPAAASNERTRSAITVVAGYYRLISSMAMPSSRAPATAASSRSSILGRDSSSPIRNWASTSRPCVRHGGAGPFGATDVDRAIAADQFLQIGPAIIHILSYIQLRFPLIQPGFGKLPLGASVTVPEAAVHEDRLAPASEHDIRPSGHVLAMQAIAISHGVKATPHDHLRLRVAALDRLHDAPGAVGGCGYPWGWVQTL